MLISTQDFNHLRTKLTWAWRNSHTLGHVVSEGPTHGKSWHLVVHQPHAVGADLDPAHLMVEEGSYPATSGQDPLLFVPAVGFMISTQLPTLPVCIHTDAPGVPSVGRYYLAASDQND